MNDILLNRRREMMQVGGGGHNLPSEYQEVEFLENIGGSYITLNTPLNYTVSQFAAYEVVFQGVGSNNWYASIISSQDWSGSNFLLRSNSSLSGMLPSAVCAINNNDALACDFFQKNQIQVRGTLDGANTNLQIVLNNTTYNRVRSASATLQKKIDLFRWSASSSFDFYGRIFYAFVNLDDAYKFELIPCYRKSDNVAGLYDKENDVFYTNAGTGNFIVGLNV